MKKLDRSLLMDVMSIEGRWLLVYKKGKGYGEKIFYINYCS